jgi:hypothetical protein
LSFKRVGATETEMRQSADQSVQYNARMIEDLLELGRGFVALTSGRD